MYYVTVIAFPHSVSVVMCSYTHNNEAATRKTAKYSNIQAHHIFQPVAVELLGPINASGRVFLSKLGRKLADQSGDERNQLFISATLRSDSAVQCHLTT